MSRQFPAPSRSKLLGWWVRGLGQPNPFFDSGTNAPRAVPRRPAPSRAVSRLLAHSERAAL
jgi:hypothetical protein